MDKRPAMAVFLNVADEGSLTAAACVVAGKSGKQQ